MHRENLMTMGFARYGLMVTLSLALSLGCSDGSSADSAGMPTSTGTATGNLGVAPSLDRLIEEGDIVWLDDPILYVLSKTNGLRVVGLGNPAAPQVLSRVPIPGTPVELYLHQGHVLALTSGGATLGESSTLLSVVAVAIPEQATVVAQLSLQGTVGTSRLVGEVLYTSAEAGAIIQSVNVANPRTPWLADRLSVALGNQGSHVLSTPTTLFVASDTYGSAAGGECANASDQGEGCTTLTAVDISSPVGTLRRGASYTLAGMLKDRWGMDYYDGVLRLVVARGQFWTSGARLSATVRTFQARTPDELAPLGYLSLKTERYENLMATRFDGPRGYVVTFLQTDPLFTLDLADPRQPKVAGYLQTPGWLDFILPRGDRILGIGRDRGPTGQWQLQASLYDVSNLAAPTLLQRVPFGGAYSTLPDQADNLAKVVRTVDALGVLLVPHNPTQVGYARTGDGRLEILRYSATTLATLGAVTSTEPILRAVPLPPSHVAAVTDNDVGIIELGTPLAIPGQVSLR
jgi:hypothetical protein